MKHGLTILVTIILFGSIAGIENFSEGKEIKFKDTGGYYIIKSDLPSLINPGYPLLPYMVKTYVFPAGTKIKRVNVDVKDVKIAKINKKIQPSPFPSSIFISEEKIKEEKVYSEDIFYPEKWYEYDMGMGINNGKRVIFLNIYLYKYRYNAVRNEIKYADFEVNIDYEPPENRSINANYDLLIIAPQEWMNDIQPLVEHKEKYGIKTKVVSIGEAESGQGSDDAERIKYFIKHEIERDGIKYVLLVGDSSIFPVRYSYADDGEEEKFVTDLYYADIYDANGGFSSWDTNGNGKYGEYDKNGEIDSVDLYPDVYVGRLACNNKNELDTAIKKIIEYEDNAYFQDWRDRIVVCGGDSFDDNDNIYEGEQIKNTSMAFKNNFRITRLYASYGNLTKDLIMDEFEKGSILYNLAGHGNRLSWATHPPGNFKKWIGFDITDVYSLKNGDKLPVVILNACSTGEFDRGTNLAWEFVAASGGGGVATFATTALSWGYVGSYCDKGLSGYMDVRFCRNFELGKYLGSVFYSAENDYMNTIPRKNVFDYKVIEEWELFGDPTLVIGGYENTTRARVFITEPANGYIYIFGNPTTQTFSGKTIIFGKIKVETKAYNVNKVEFYFDGELKYTDDSEPYEWECDERAFFSHELKVIGYGNGISQDIKNVIIFNI